MAVYAVLVGRILVPAGMNPLVVARLSRDFATNRFWDQHPVFEQFDGYDGQFYYYLARDPMLISGDIAFMDAPAYRYQRILLPSLAWLLAFGQAGAIGWSLVAVNALSLTLGCVVAARLFDHWRLPRWWLLAYALNPGFVLGVAQDLAEPLALALVTAGVWAWLTERHPAAIAALTLAVLARETTLLVPLGFAGYYVVRAYASERTRAAPGRRSSGARQALGYCLPLGVFGLWQMVVLWHVGALPVGIVAKLLTGPGAGLYQTLRPLLGLEPGISLSDLDGASRLTGAVGMLAQACAAAVAIACLRLRSALRWQLALQGLFVLCAGAPVWRDVASFPRDAMLLYFFFLMVVAAEHSPAVDPGVLPSQIRLSPRHTVP